jgi:hypothetical protein
MSTVPSKSASFVHGVKDNVPPFSFQKVVVQPWNNPSSTTQEQSHKFRIPQFGTLNRAYLRIKTVNQVPLATDATGGPRIEESDYNTLHDANSGAAAVNADYTNLNGQVRFPWVHKSQVGGNVASKDHPFGYGGSLSITQTALVNPETSGSAQTANAQAYSSSNLLVDPEARLGDSSNAWNVVNILDEMRLTTNGKLIETVYGETIPAEVVKMPQQLRDFYMKGMTGWACGSNAGGVLSEPNYEEAWDPSACLRDAYGRYTTNENQLGDTAQCVLRNQHANFIVPVTLSSLKSLPKNYQTRFVEDLELEVKMKELARGFNRYASATDSTKYHVVELVLIYHNWHDNIENTIRNSNYKRGVPASVYSTNWVRAATTTAALSNTLPLSIPLTSRNLVTELVVVARSKKASAIFANVDSINTCKSDYRIFLDKEFSYSVELLGSGKTIWSSTNRELMGPDSADYDLVERKMAGGDCGYGGAASKRLNFDPRIKGRGFDTTATDIRLSSEQVSHGGVDYSFNDNMAIMRFGFQTGDEFYSGGIALQTISNPTIKITPPAALSGDTWLDVGLEFDVYVKHANLVRIDSDTGAVTRTLDV